MPSLDDLTRASMVKAPPGFVAYQRDHVPEADREAMDALVIESGGEIFRHPPIKSNGLGAGLAGGGWTEGGTSYYVPEDVL